MGSKYVAIAKEFCLQKFNCQERMFAGESEIVCWCDNSASPDEIAYAQSEHSEGVYISNDLERFKINKKVQKR